MKSNMDYIFLNRGDGGGDMKEDDAVRLLREFCVQSGKFYWVCGGPIRSEIPMGLCVLI